MKPWLKLAAGGAGALAIAAAMAGYFEGRSYAAYRDFGGVWTICNGHTRGVHEGMTATSAQCDAWQREDTAIARGTVRGCYPQPPRAGIEAALIDLAFNVGPGAKGRRDGVCVLRSGRKPTIRLRAEAGDWAGVCNGLLAWDKADGHVLPGLVQRRTEERALCLQ